MWSTLFLFETILSLTFLLVLTIYYEEKSLTSRRFSRRFIEETKEVVILNTVYFSNLTNIGTHNTKAITQVCGSIVRKITGHKTLTCSNLIF